jgi:predicted SAM-dependent methyltransferase
MVVPVEIRRRLKAILRPVASPLLWRLRLPFDVMLPRIELLEKRIASIPDPALRETVDNLTRTWLRLQNEVARLSSSVPEAAASAAQARGSELEARLQAAERQLEEDIAGRGHGVDDSLRFLLDRIELVLRETMLQRRYGAGGWPALWKRPPAVQPRILAPEKVQAAQASGALRLNLGCGHVPEAGYINVDMRDLPGVDVVAEEGALPFEPGSVDEIFSSHLVERFPQEEMRHRLLPHWYRMLKPGGCLHAVTPDGEAMIAGLAQGAYTFEDFRRVLFGGQDHGGNFHQNLYTPDSLSRMVEEAGFTSVEVPARGQRNGRCFEFELVALVPATTGRQ